MAGTLLPRLHVSAHLPPVISFSSTEEPRLEIIVTLLHSESVIIALQRSRLWPLNLRSAIVIRNLRTGREEYVPRVDCRLGPTISRLTRANEDKFLGLRPGQSSIVSVSFRPHEEPYDYEKFKDRGTEKYRFIFPIGMQFLKPGEGYEICIDHVERHGYMEGDLDEIIAKTPEGSDFRYAEGSLEVVPGESWKFRVES